MISDILSGSLSPQTPRDKENEHEAKSKGNSRTSNVTSCDTCVVMRSFCGCGKQYGLDSIVIEVEFKLDCVWEGVEGEIVEFWDYMDVSGGDL